MCLIRYGYVNSTFYKLLIGHTYEIMTPLKCTILTDFRSLWSMLPSKKGWSQSGSHRKLGGNEGREGILGVGGAIILS